MPASQSSDRGFQERLWGNFSGVLRWEQLDELWKQVLEKPEGWYLCETKQPLPEETVFPHELRDRIHEIDGILRKKHEHDSCGIVYVDDFAEPGMIKVYDPKNLGMVCGHGGERVMPRWIVSREKPTATDGNSKTDASQGNRRWWKRFFS